MSQEEGYQKQEEAQQIILQPLIDQGNQPLKRKNKKRPILNPSQITGHWSEKEHKTYLDFLNVHKAVMESSDQKKTSKIFKLMSETIGTRSPSQCRSHHQKFNPFLHQVKKRQKGAGRKKRESGIQAEKPPNGFIDNQYFAQMLNHPYYIQQQMPADNQLMFPPFSFVMPFLDGVNREEDKIVSQDQQLYLPPFIMNQTQFMDDKNQFYNFGYPHPQQIQVNFNYFQPMNNEYYVNNSAELLNKDVPSEEE